MKRIATNLVRLAITTAIGLLIGLAVYAQQAGAAPHTSAMRVHVAPQSGLDGFEQWRQTHVQRRKYSRQPTQSSGDQHTTGKVQSHGDQLPSHR